MSAVASYVRMIEKARKNLSDSLSLLLSQKDYFKKFDNFQNIVTTSRALIDSSDQKSIEGASAEVIVFKTHALVSQTGVLRTLYEQAVKKGVS